MEGNFFREEVDAPPKARHRRQAADGTEGICRLFGLKDRDVEIVRVVGVCIRLPIADVPEFGAA